MDSPDGGIDEVIDLDWRGMSISIKAEMKWQVNSVWPP